MSVFVVVLVVVPSPVRVVVVVEFVLSEYVMIVTTELPALYVNEVVIVIVVGSSALFLTWAEDMDDRQSTIGELQSVPPVPV